MTSDPDAVASASSSDVGPAVSKSSRISVRIAASRAAPELEAPADSRPSAWLYAAGLTVTMIGLYATNYDLEDPNFAILTFGLALAGYAVSYVMRLRSQSFRGLYLPLAVCLAIVAVIGIVTGQGPGWLGASGAANVASANLQVVIAWFAVLQTFALSSDSLVLLSCAPTITLLALVSTNTPDTEIQFAYLAFVVAATFLIVHENYLRTHTVTQQSAREHPRDRLFGGQVALALICVVATFVAANVVAVPLRMVGAALYRSGALSQLNNTANGFKPPRPAISAGPQSTYELAIGPIALSEQPLMTIQCLEPLYWRGLTFNYYTGHSFENKVPGPPATPLEVDVPNMYWPEPPGGVGPGFASIVHSSVYVPWAPLQLAPKDMHGSREVRQHYRVLSGNPDVLYCAGEPTRLRVPSMSVNYNKSGSLILNTTLGDGAEYDIVSTVATNDVSALRSAPAAPISKDIAEHYLELAPPGHDESRRVRELAEQTVQGLTNNYDRVMALKSVVAARCKYNMKCAPAPRDRDVVDYFLFDSQEGYCDSFAAALTMLCRYAQIPARVATGFLPGKVVADYKYLVTDADRHMWTEVFFPQIGWVTVDATEGTVDVTPKDGMGRSPMKALAAWFRSQGSGPKIIMVVLVCLLAYVIKTEVLSRLPSLRRPTARTKDAARHAAVIQAYVAATTALARRGYPRAPNVTPDEFASQLSGALGEPGAPIVRGLQTLTVLHARSCYNPQTAAETSAREAAEALSALTAALRELGPGGKRGRQAHPRTGSAPTEETGQ